MCIAVLNVGKISKTQWNIYSKVHSRNYLILRPIFFTYPIPYTVVFVGVHMKSRKSYGVCDFSLFEKVTHYIGENCGLSKEILIEDISKLVYDEILLKDKKIMINKVYIVFDKIQMSIQIKKNIVSVY